MRGQTLTHQFVEFVPDQLQEGILYVSLQYATAAHACCCGCGNEVITPFSPTDWQLTFDGETISLSPSIGNWSFACRSHYWIKHNRVAWAANMSKQAIEAGRASDRHAKARQYGKTHSTSAATPAAATSPQAEAAAQRTLFARCMSKVKSWWS
jgi:Family of unknown function (DUF6527)